MLLRLLPALLLPIKAFGVKPLGQGGMATVQLAEQVDLGRLVAIKLMNAELNTIRNFKTRFLREARIMADLNHANIVTIYDVGEVQEGIYICMEYADGGDLKARIKQGISQVSALSILADIARALEYAHNRSYIHRDIKPENILFNKSGELLVTDFGIAKSLDTLADQLTQTGLSLGTPAYMAPEQFDEGKLDHRADLYSLGILFYEMLMGTKPYRATSKSIYMRKHLSDPIPELPAQLSHFSHLLHKLMAKEKEERAPSAGWVIDQCEGLRNDLARP